MADLFKTPQKGQPRSSRSRRKAMTQEEIQALKQKVAVTPKANRPFVFDQPTAPGEETQRKIVLAAHNSIWQNRIHDTSGTKRILAHTL